VCGRDTIAWTETLLALRLYTFLNPPGLYGFIVRAKVGDSTRSSAAPDPARQAGCFPFAKPALDLFRDQVKRSHGIMRTVFGDYVVPRNLVADRDTKRIDRGFHVIAFESNARSKSAGSVLTHPADLSEHRFLKLLGHLNAAGANNDV
jgi:hypothetical protein